MKSLSTLVWVGIGIFFSAGVCGADKIVLSAIADSANTDISEAVLRLAYQKMGLEVDVLYYPSKRAIRAANNGVTDGELYRVAGVEMRHTHLIKVPVPVNKMEAVVLTKGHQFRVNGWQSLTPYVIGKRAGVWFSDQGTLGMTTHNVNTNKSGVRV